MNRFIAKIVTRPNGNAGGGRSTPHQERRLVVTRAESAPCTCPDACERDHEND
jgi:hypothetical protein